MISPRVTIPSLIAHETASKRSEFQHKQSSQGRPLVKRLAITRPRSKRLWKNELGIGGWPMMIKFSAILASFDAGDTDVILWQYGLCQNISFVAQLSRISLSCLHASIDSLSGGASMKRKTYFTNDFIHTKSWSPKSPVDRKDPACVAGP